jgi:hypothetical protein
MRAAGQFKLFRVLGRSEMISLSDSQLDIVTTFARGLEPEKRSDYLQRIAADLAVRHGYRFSDTDVSAAAQAALTSLMQREPRAYFFLGSPGSVFCSTRAASGVWLRTFIRSDDIVRRLGTGQSV